MHNEQVFTPSWMVRLMLDKLQYSGNGVLQKHIIDNSCGKGAFLTDVVDRYCKAYIAANGSENGLKHELETYIHGIEVDEACWGITIVNLNKVALKYNIEDVNWNIINGDALGINSFDGKMDYVVGNPPYCKVHDFGDKYDLIKKYTFVQGGMPDLYLAFFEIGIHMLNETGKLIYITPSTWTVTVAGKTFRKYLIENNTLSDVIVMEHEQIFPEATTFTMITQIDNSKKDIKEDYNKVTLYKYNPKTVDFDYIATRPLSLFTVGEMFCFVGDTDTLNLMKGVNKHEYDDIIKVKNGFATLNDKLFIIDENIPETDPRFVAKDYIMVIKASTGEQKWAIFPYNMQKDMKPFKFDELSEYARNYLLERANELHLEEQGRMKGKWWLYGRTQAINYVATGMRYSVSPIISCKEDVIVKYVFSGMGVYGGVFVIPNGTELDFDVEECLKTDEFISYVKALGRFKNGGYYTFSSKELQNYLNYKYKQSRM